ncbi:MAG: ribonuclease P protein component [Eubacteriales bacterium]|nr:ribonuclease P protein component [Eubacteriales bacterium]
MRHPLILKKNYEFDRVYKKGKSEHGAELSLFYVPRKDKGSSHFGVTVSRKVRGAVQRNRVKRVLRELCYLYLPYIKPGYDFVLTGRSLAERGSFKHLQRDFEKLLLRAKLLETDCANERLATSKAATSCDKTSDSSRDKA